MVMNVNQMIEKYPEIVAFFTLDWLKSELEKKREEMHILARQFHYDDKHSFYYLNHLEIYLKVLSKEIKSLPHYRKRLKRPDSYDNALAEIEVAHLFKSGGFEIELEPKIPNSNKKSDIKLIENGTDVYIEIRRVKRKEGKILEKVGRTELREMEFHKTIDIKGKIEDEIHGLSEEHPGIITLHLDQGIVNYLDFEKAFYDGILYYSNGTVLFRERGESTTDNSVISALLLYQHNYNNEGCNIMDLFLNPKATLSINEKTINHFMNIGIKCKSSLKVIK